MSRPTMTAVEKQTRIYHFPGGHVAEFENVVCFGMRKGGTTHRLELEDGTKVVVASGWLWIELPGLTNWSL